MNPKQRPSLFTGNYCGTNKIKTMKNKILLIIAIIAHINCDANQDSTNIDTVKFHSTNTFGGYWNNTNASTTTLYNIGTNCTIGNKKHAIYAISTYVYGTQNKKTSNNDLSVTLNTILGKDQKIFKWASLQYDHSYSLKIEYRLQSGLGLGYYIIKNKNVNISISDGILYDMNLYNDIGSHNVYRNSARAKISIKGKVLSFESVTFYQPAITDSRDYVFKTTNTTTVKLKKWLELHMNVTDNIIWITDKQNFLCTFGVTITT